MTFFIISYVLVVLSVAGLVVLFSTNGVVIGVTYATFGIGLVFALIPVNAIVPLIIFFPSVVSGGGLRPIAFGLGVICYIGFLTVPAMIGKRELPRIMAHVASEDLPVPAQPAGVRRFELKFATDISHQVCEMTCRALLKGGHAEWVRVVYDGPKKSQLIYTFGVNQETGELTSLENDKTPADLIVSQTRVTLKDVFEQFSPYELVVPGVSQRYEVLRYEGGGYSAIYQVTEVAYQLVDRPTVFQPNIFSAKNTDGYDLKRTTYNASEINHSLVLQNMGWDLPSEQTIDHGPQQSPPPSSADVSLINRILDRTDPAPFSLSDGKLIRNYVDQVQLFDELPESHRRLMERIIKEHRFQSHSGIPAVLGKDKELRIRILPWVFERLKNGDGMTRQVSHYVVETFVRSNQPDELAPYFDCYLALLEESDFKNDWLLWAAGRFGQDPSPIIARVISPTADGMGPGFSILRNADPRWQDGVSLQLLQAYREYLQLNTEIEDWMQTRRAAVSLSRYGHTAEVRKILQDRGIGEDWNL